MLYYAGLTKRIGNVDSGSTVTDHLRAERERGITITSACVTLPWEGCRINLIDTPGHVDFTVEVERAVRVLDGAIAILDAVAGVEAQTATVWRQADRYGIPRILFINKLDREGADIDAAISQVREKLKAHAVSLQIPYLPSPTTENPATSASIQPPRHHLLDLITMEELSWEDGPDATGAFVVRKRITPSHLAYDEAVEGRRRMLEGIAEVDDTLLDHYLSLDAPWPIPVAEVRAAIRRSSIAGSLVPVLYGAARRNVGVQPLMDAIIEYLPSPEERPLLASLASPSTKSTSKPIPKGSLCALAFKVIWDGQRGPLVFLRLYSGTLRPKDTLFNSTRKIKERVRKLLQVHADSFEEIPEAGAGNTLIVSGLRETRTGDTLVLSSDRPSHSLILPGIPTPPPVFVRAVEPDGAGDQRDVEEALAHLLLEDPSLRVSQDPGSGQTLLSGMGELHLEVAEDRLCRDWKVKCTLGQVRISYRETITHPAKVNVQYSREGIGRVDLSIQLTPLPSAYEGKGVEEEDGNEVDTQNARVDQEGNCSMTTPEILQAIQDGIQGSLARGQWLYYPFLGVCVQVTQVRVYGEETTGPILRAAAAQAISEGTEAAGITLLEPLMQLDLRIPTSRIGPVISDLTGRRGGMVEEVVEEETNAESRVHASVPLGGMVGYSGILRGLTAGEGGYSMEMQGWGKMSKAGVDEVVKQVYGG